MRTAQWLFCVVFGACASGVGVPKQLRSGSTERQLEQVAIAQASADRGEVRAALAILDAMPRGEVVEAERLRQDLLRQRGRLGALREEARLAVEANPRSSASHYLLGRVQPTNQARESFEAAIQLDPQSLWPWMGLAFSLRDEDFPRSLALYEAAYEASGRHHAVGVAYANALRGSSRKPQALEVYEQMIKRGGVYAGIGHLGIAQTLFTLGDSPDERNRGWASLLVALRERPSDPGVHAILRELLRGGANDDQWEQCLDALRESESRWRQFARGAATEVLVGMLARLRQPQAALAAIESIPASARAPEVAATHRRLLLACGDARAFHETLLDWLPAKICDHESNQSRGVWAALRSACAVGEDPIRDAVAAIQYATALRDAGLLAESEMVCVASQRRFGSGAQADKLLDEVRREIAFENSLRRALYRGYAKDETTELDAFVAEARRASIECLGRDVVDPDIRFRAPLVGQMLDPFASGLCRHLGRYNRHLVVGRRAGGVPEGLMFTRLSVRDLPQQEGLSVPGRCLEVLGTDRSVRSVSGVLGGDIAGIALMNHYIVDYDAVVEWAQAIARRRRIIEDDGRVALSDQLPDLVDPLDPLDANFRLSAASSLQDNELVEAVLETIQLHERRHIVDSFHYMPVEQNLMRAVALLVVHGFSAFAIESEMERRAELAALAFVERPEVALAHIAEFVVEDDQHSPHARGFTELARQLIGALQAEGVSAQDAAVSRWHRLDRETVRRAAKRLLRDLP
jgi:tetratricopeptide (TPR) repeat protein